MSNRALTQGRLKELLHYDSETGIFIRRVTVSSRAKKGDVAGNLNARGYLRVRLDGAEYYLHRLACLYMTGKFPESDTDHVKGNKADNRWSKIRPVTSAENHKNMRIPLDNTSGTVGVGWHKKAEKWRAYIAVDGESFHLGLFADKSDAITARKDAEKEYGFHENHGDRPSVDI